MNRRQVLAAAGSVSLGSLLAACGAGRRGRRSHPERHAGGHRHRRAQARPRHRDRGAFDESASCRLTPRRPRGPTTSTSTRSAATSARTARAPRCGSPCACATPASCEPIENAVVDLWHCDALGVYSGFESAHGGGGRTDDETYLRGAQVTNADGIAEFTTIYPGLLRGPHRPHPRQGPPRQRQTVLTTQLYFDDDVTARSSSAALRAAHAGRDVSNDDDGIFDDGCC